MTPFQSITFVSPECTFDFLKHKLAFNKVGIKFDLGLKVGLFGPCSYLVRWAQTGLVRSSLDLALGQPSAATFSNKIFGDSSRLF